MTGPAPVPTAHGRGPRRFSGARGRCGFSRWTAGSGSRAGCAALFGPAGGDLPALLLEGLLVCGLSCQILVETKAPAVPHTLHTP